MVVIQQTDLVKCTNPECAVEYPDGPYVSKSRYPSLTPQQIEDYKKKGVDYRDRNKVCAKCGKSTLEVKLSGHS